MGKKNKKVILKKELRIREKKFFMNKIAVICEKMVGPGHFELFPDWLLLIIFQKRYPPLKIVCATPNVISPIETIHYRRNLLKLFQEESIETLRGEKLPFMWYFRDILILIHALQFKIREFGGSSVLANAFRPYFTDGEWYKKCEEKMLGLIAVHNVQMFDFNKGMLVTITDQTVHAKDDSQNTFRLYRFRPEIIRLEIEGHLRPLIPLATFTNAPGIELVTAIPSRIGFTTILTTEPRKVYVQKHTLIRFEERLRINPGYAIPVLARAFQDESIKYLRSKERILLECRLGEYKVGYFVVSCLEESLIVHTFLFLTSDSTPEGRKLEKLTQLKRMDQKYLGIDSMDSFLLFDIAADKQLKDIFYKAGCGSLIEYSQQFHSFYSEYVQFPTYMSNYIKARA